MSMLKFRARVTNYFLSTRSPMPPVSWPVRSDTPPVLPPVNPEKPVSFPLPVMPLNIPPLSPLPESDLSPSLLPVKSETLLDGPPVRSFKPPVLPPVSSDAPCVFAGAERLGPATGSTTDMLYQRSKIQPPWYATHRRNLRPLAFLQMCHVRLHY